MQGNDALHQAHSTTAGGTRNPYIAGNPVDAATGFFGRDDVLRVVSQVLRQPRSNAIVLYGQRRIGKTSVLLQLRRRLAAQNDLTPVYFDLQDKAAQPLGQLLFDLAERISLVTGSDPPQRDAFDDAGSHFREAFLPDIARAVGGQGLALLLDEFDVLDVPAQAQAGQAFFPYLRRFMAEIERVAFVFVLGRRPEDLSIETLSTFKSVRATRIGALDRPTSEALVKQAEADGRLAWTDEAVERAWWWPHGHPYLTQLLCSVVWENALGTSASSTPRVSARDVDAAIDEVLRQGANAFFWIWDGLPPAERVVMAAMAEAKDEAITGEGLLDLLTSSGVRLIVRELELAPDTMVDWDLLEAVDGGYRFTVPLLRHWVARHRPLRRVKDELDRLDPLAEDLYRTGQRFYALQQIEQAQIQLRHALTMNPNHLKARLLLGRILFEIRQLPEAVAILEEALRYDDRAPRADLIQTLLALAETKEESGQAPMYRRVLELDPRQPVAFERLEHLRRMQQERDIALRTADFTQCLEIEDWAGAISVANDIGARYPESEWATLLAQAQAGQALADDYAIAIDWIKRGEHEQAQRPLARVIGQQPAYKEAARFLLLAVTGIDVEILKLRLRADPLEIEISKRGAAAGALSTTRWASVRQQLKALARSGDPTARIQCPYCNDHVSRKRLVQHYDRRHASSPELDGH